MVADNPIIIPESSMEPIPAAVTSDIYLPVSEISTKLGFENPESFIRVFKKEMNITPAKYRKTSNVI